MRLIGFCGLAGSGKSTAAGRLIDRHRFVRHPFAGPIKLMIAALMNAEGATAAEVQESLYGAEKAKPTRFLAGASPRAAMQTLGTEWGRELHTDFWLNAWGLSWPHGADVVVDDVRFSNEAAQIRAMGGVVIRVERADVAALAGKAALHASERQVFTPDAVLVNNGDVAALCAAVDAIVGHLAPSAAARFA